MKIKMIAIVLLLALGLTACGEHAVKPDGSGSTAGGGSTDSATAGGAQVGSINGSGIEDEAVLAGQSYAVSYAKGAIDDPGNILSNKIIYFDYDSSQVNDKYLELVKHHGKYLALHADESIRLEGHTDERGTREYNIALADRRAQSVKRILMFQGAASEQITIISYGEEKPSVLGHDEESWSLNRRAELVYRK